MANKRGFRRVETGSTAVFVRVLAFLIALAAIFTIPATIVATTAGQLTLQVALYAVGGAVGLIALAAAAVRPFDPLRR